MDYHGYPKVWALGHRFLEELLLDPVIVQEKLDGSQFSFCLDPDRGLRAWSHHRELDLEAPDKLFTQAVETVRQIESRLTKAYIYRGEYLSKPKHHTLAYDRTPKGHVALFDINNGLESYLAYEDVAAEALNLGLDVVPLIYQGMVTSVDHVKGFLARESYLGGPQIEGVVVKNYRRFGLDGHALMGKYVSEQFKELAKITFKGNLDLDIVTGLLDALNTEARWVKALQAIEERGELKNDLPDIGPLMAQVKQDIKAECMDLILEKIQEALDKKKGAMVSSVIKGVGRGIPEWYKARLLERQFSAV